MNAEIVEAIRELGQTSCWEKASVIIGGISILLTLVVLWYNHKSIKLTQQTIRQATNLQLYEKRLELYSGISKYYAFTDTPLELNIDFYYGIYKLYAEIVCLCNIQDTYFDEYCRSVQYRSRYDCMRHDIAEDAYKDIIENIDKAVKLLPIRGEELHSRKKKIQSVHQKICNKYECLELKMKKIIKDSIS